MNEAPFLGWSGVETGSKKKPIVGSTEIWYDAYGAEFLAIWDSSPFAREVPHLCHVRAYTCFFNSEDQDIEARRRLLFWFLARTFSIDRPDDTLRRMYSILPCDSSILKRSIRNLCIAYNEAPARTFQRKGAPLNDIESGIVSRWYKRGRVDVVLQNAYRFAKLTNTVLIHVGQVGGDPLLSVYPADLFRVLPNEKNRLIAREVWIASILDGNLCYKVWTAPDGDAPGLYKVIDAATNAVLSQVETGYSRLPFVTLRLDQNCTDFYGGGRWELVESQLKVNKLEMSIDENVDYNAIGVWMATNLKIDPNKFRLSPGFMLQVEDVVAMEGSPLPPTLEHINAQTHYSELAELQKTRERRAMQNQGLPSSVTNNDTASNLSGVAMLIDQKELIEARNEDVVALRGVENDLFECLVVVMNQDAAAGINPDGLELSVDFAEPRVFTDPAADFDFATKKFNAGLMSPKDYVREITGNDLINTDQDAIDFMKNNRDFITQMGANNASTVP